MRDSEDKPDIVRDIIWGQFDKQRSNNNNNESNEDGNESLMSNIKEIKGTEK